MQFLVKITSQVPPDMEDDRRKSLIEAERARVTELREQGKLIGVWKVPVVPESITAWEVDDAVELHVLLMSLPAIAWTDATVLPLVQRHLLPH